MSRKRRAKLNRKLELAREILSRPINLDTCVERQRLVQQDGPARWAKMLDKTPPPPHSWR